MSEDDLDFDDPEELAAYMTFLEDAADDAWLTEVESEEVDYVTMEAVPDEDVGLEW